MPIDPTAARPNGGCCSLGVLYVQYTCTSSKVKSIHTSPTLRRGRLAQGHRRPFLLARPALSRYFCVRFCGSAPQRLYYRRCCRVLVVRDVTAGRESCAVSRLFFFFRWTTVRRCLLGAGAPPWFPPPPQSIRPLTPQGPSRSLHCCHLGDGRVVVAAQGGAAEGGAAGRHGGGDVIWWEGGRGSPRRGSQRPVRANGAVHESSEPVRRRAAWTTVAAAARAGGRGSILAQQQRRPTRLPATSRSSPRAPGGGGHAMPPLSTPPLPPFTCRGRRACATAASHDAPATPLSFLSSRRRHRSHFALRVSPKHTTGCARYHSGGGEAPRSCSTVALSPAAPRPPTHQTLPPRSVSSCSPVSLPPLCCRGESSGVARGQFFPLLPLRRTAQDSRHVARVGGWTDGNRRRGG